MINGGNRDQLDLYFTLSSPWQLRVTFVAMVISGASAIMLYESYKFWMWLDLPHGVLQAAVPIPDQVREQMLLRELMMLLEKERHTLDEYGLPMPEDVADIDVVAREFERYSAHDLHAHCSLAEHFSDEQRVIFDLMMDPQGPQMVYTEAFAGCGKSFVAQCILAHYRRARMLPVVVAPSAKAAQQFPGGQTSHSCFELPVVAAGCEVVSRLSANTLKGRLAQSIKLIIIDELPMQHVDCFHAIDKCMREIQDPNKPFGGVRVLGMGNFAQLAPVVVGSSPQELVAASVRSSPLFHQFHFTELVLPQRDAGDPEYAAFVRSIAVGSGNFLSDELPMSVRVLDGSAYDTTDVLLPITRLITSMSGRPSDVLYGSTVCAAVNEIVNQYNNVISDLVASHLNVPITDCIAQETCDDGDPEAQDVASIDIMEGFDDTQFPSHCLRLFPGCLISLIRNFLPSYGLTNGTLLIVKKLGRHSIQCVKADSLDQQVYTIFRFRLRIEIPHLFAFVRQQFPVRVAFAQTVHRLQSVTIRPPAVMIYDARIAPFTHALAYVAMSRVCQGSQVTVVTADGDRRLPVNVVLELITGFSYAEVDDYPRAEDALDPDDDNPEYEAEDFDVVA